jgi:probable phosphoglycerate mutase
MRLFLLRHGESQHSQRGIIAGYASCPGLTSRGFQQAQLLADRLRATGEAADCVALLSSTVLRAQQTAEVLGRELGLGPIEQDCDLCELHPGAADGLAWEAYRQIYGGFDLVAEPDRPFADGAESWLEFLGRVRLALDRLAARFEGQTVIAVTHAGFIVAAFLVLFAVPRPGARARRSRVCVDYGMAVYSTDLAVSSLQRHSASTELSHGSVVLISLMLR